MTPRARPERARPDVFRLYPEPGTRYVRAVVWPTHAAMAAHGKSIGYPIGRRTMAHCFGVLARFYGKDGRQWTRGIVAEAHFSREMLTAEVVTHEMLHAAYAWARRVKFDFGRLGAEDSINDDEERLCYLHTHLCAAFVERAHAAGLYGDNWWEAGDFRPPVAA